jgi:AcrR family transcriptional regulator
MPIPMSRESQEPSQDHPLGAPFAARRQKIVEAAARLFAEAPYADVHMDAIAGAAAVAKPTLYRYFPTKERLFVEALDATLTQLRAELEGVRAGAGSAEARLRRMIALILARIGRLVPAIQASESASRESAADSRRVLRQGFRNLREAIGGVVAEGGRDGDFGAVDPDLAALVILGGVRMAAHARIGAHDLPDAMADLFFNGLRSADVPSRHSASLAAGAFA